MTGHWSDLLLWVYEAPEALVRRYVAPPLEPDRWRGKTHVNLVALHFGDIRVRGRRIPGLGGFAQINLRTFARLDGTPGVVFIRQYVPNPFVVAVSRLRYHQPYRTLPIAHLTASRGDEVTVEYALDRPPQGCLIARGSARTVVPDAGTFEHYCKERFWAFGRGRGDRILRFRVEHPPWEVREVRERRLLLDFGTLFGPDWRFLSDAEPAAVVFAVGSAVTIYDPEPRLSLTDSTSTSP